MHVKYICWSCIINITYSSVQSGLTKNSICGRWITLTDVHGVKKKFACYVGIKIYYNTDGLTIGVVSWPCVESAHDILGCQTKNALFPIEHDKPRCLFSKHIGPVYVFYDTICDNSDMFWYVSHPARIFII